MIANISPSSLTYEDTYNTLKYADRAKQIKTPVVRNVLNVEFHISRYRAIVQEQQKEIAELKSKLETKTPGKKAATSSVDITESNRLHDLVRGVYGERLRLRKHMVDLDTQERETLLRICRKERDLHRIATLTGNEAKTAKLAAKVSSLQQQIVETERQKQMVHEYLYSNNEAVSRVQREVKTATANAPALQDLMKEVVQGRKLETENAHHWRQTKHLLRYVKAQEREIGKTERVLLLALEVARKQHTLLRSHNALTPSVREMYTTLAHAAEGEKGVAWADLNATTSDVLHDTPMNGGVGYSGGLSVSQKALFDTFLVHASPARRLSLDKHSPATVSKPVTGILSNPGHSTTVVAGSSNKSTTGCLTRRDSEASTSCVDSGVGPLGTCERSNSDTSSSSVVSSIISSKLSSSLPDKPRMPTPIDDLSSSCSSNNSIYDTRLNTVINSYHQKPATSPTVITKAGRYTKLPTSRGGTPTPYDSPQITPRGTPEPYLTPMPSLHKLTLTRQNSEWYQVQKSTFNPQPPPPPPTCSHTNWTTLHSQFPTDIVTSTPTTYSSVSIHSNGDEKEGKNGFSSRGDNEGENRHGGVMSSAFTPLKMSSRLREMLSPPQRAASLVRSNSSCSSTDYTRLISKATRLQSAPIPPPRPPRNTADTLLPSSKSIPSTSSTKMVSIPSTSSTKMVSRSTHTYAPTSSSYGYSNGTRPHPPPTSSSAAFTTPAFEDNFVSLPTTTTSVCKNSPLYCSPPVPPRRFSRSSPRANLAKENNNKSVSRSPVSESSKDTEATLSQESEGSSHSSSSTVKSMEHRRSGMEQRRSPSTLHYPHNSKQPPVVTVETHSTLVSVHPPQPHHSSASLSSFGVNIKRNNSKPSNDSSSSSSSTRPHPPAFTAPPSSFNSQQQHKHTTTTQISNSTNISTKPKYSTKSSSILSTTRDVPISNSGCPDSVPSFNNDRSQPHDTSSARETQNLSSTNTREKDTKSDSRIQRSTNNNNTDRGALANECSESNTTTNESPLNSTFTVQPSKWSTVTAGGKISSIGWGTRQQGMTVGERVEVASRQSNDSGVIRGGGVVVSSGFKPVPGALKMLHVNSPHALGERLRNGIPGGESVKTRKTRAVPNYLQMTKAAASKRVAKIQNKENGTTTVKKYGLGRTTRPSPPVAQSSW